MTDEPQSREPHLRFRSNSVPVRLLLPSFFTLLGLCAGLTAIRMGIDGRYELAIGAIVLAAFLDAVDGRVARFFKASTKFGAELDSLADFVNFGVAPAIIIFVWALGPLKSLGWVVVLIYAVCSALRLARFNSALETPEAKWKKNFFQGVPAPAGAIVVLLPLYLHQMGFTFVQEAKAAILFYVLVIGLLMVSTVPTYSGKSDTGNVRSEWVVPLYLATAVYIALGVTYPYKTLAVSSLIYLVAIPYVVVRYRRLAAKYGDDPDDGALLKTVSDAANENAKSDTDAA